MTNRTFFWVYSGSCLFAAVSFAALAGGVWSFIVGVLMFFCGGFFERGRAG